jgi:acylphosphatase
VQGVGFRWYVRDRAGRHGVAGWVRNVADGSVEFVARGETADIDGFLADVRRGSSRARVDGVRVMDAGSGTDFPDPFDIRRDIE